MITIGEQRRPPIEAEVKDLSRELRAALSHLVKAYDYARDVVCDPWEFAIEIDRLIALGLTTSDLRWLVKKGYIEHGREITQPDDAVRRFQRLQNLGFSRGSCFLLAEAACSSLEAWRGCLAAPAVVSAPAQPALLPCWDGIDRTLRVGGQIVKEYRVPSPNQEAVLAAFHEEGWPHYVDDPLSPLANAEQCPKYRLRDTIKCLNANQRNRLIRFRGDGTGERIGWELTEIASLRANGPSDGSRPIG